LQPTTKQIDFARSIPLLWDPLTDEQRQMLVEQLVVKTYNRGDIIYQPGDESTYLAYLFKGKVRIELKGIGDRKQIVDMMAPGDFFGYQSAFQGMPHELSAVAGEKTQVALIPMELMFHLIWENSQIAMIFIKELSTLLGMSAKRTISLTQKHIRGRLAETLLSMKRKYGVEPDGKTLAVYLSRGDLADLSNMNTSNAIRTLSSFAEEGLIELDGRKLRFLDEEKLRKISHLG
jgi:CRP-like cAMP-binding protein